MIRVCQVLHGIVGGGSEQVVLNYCSRMRNIHFDLLYQYEPNPQILERFNEAGINCIQIPDKIHHPLKHLWKMFNIFRKGNYDVVHSHLDWYMNSYVCFLAMLAGVKKRVAHHHQAYSKWGLFCSIMRIPCKLFATRWLACGEAAAINGWGRSAVKHGKVTILPNAIDPERFKYNEGARKEIRSRYGIKEDDFVIGHVGRFFPEKNHRFIIKMFGQYCQNHEKCRLLFVGNGPLLTECQKMVELNGLGDKIVFAGLQKETSPDSMCACLKAWCTYDYTAELGKRDILSISEIDGKNLGRNESPACYDIQIEKITQSDVLSYPYVISRCANTPFQ